MERAIHAEPTLISGTLAYMAPEQAWGRQSLDARSDLYSLGVTLYRLLTGASALDNLRALDLERHGHEALLERAWALRDNLTAYDAVYVALAEALECTLLTCDGRLARSPGQSPRVELVR